MGRFKEGKKVKKNKKKEEKEEEEKQENTGPVQTPQNGPTSNIKRVTPMMRLALK